MIYLHTLGDCLIKVDEKEIRPSSPLLFAALLYLGMERGRRVPRAALQELFFPNSDERSGAHSVRQLLYKLRQLAVPLSPHGPAISVDADFVHDSLDSFSTTQLLSTSGSRDVRVLPGFSPLFSDAFNDWLDNFRYAAELKIRRRCVHELNEARNASDWTLVDEVARLILTGDPLNEEAHLALAEATAMTGSKIAALQILDRYSTETGGDAPRLPTAMLRRRISEQAWNIGDSSRPTAIVGRSAELALLTRELHTCRRQRRLLIVQGHAGIGKSRLIAELAARAEIDGARVVTIQCRKTYAGRPFGVWVDLVPRLLSLRGAIGISPTALHYLEVFVRDKEHIIREISGAQDVQIRTHVLTDALVDLFAAVASEQRLVVIVEDAHWADADSLNELATLASANREPPLLFVVTTRPPDSHFHVILDSDTSLTCELGPMSAEDMTTLASRFLGGSELLAEVREWCAKTSGGNPLYLQMLCDSYASSGHMLEVPDTLRDLIRERVRQLPDGSRRVLELCAVLSRRTTVETLLALTQLNRVDLLTSVQRLSEQGFIELAGEEIRSGHELLAQVTAELMSPLSRRLLHTLAAKHMEACYEETRDVGLMWDTAEHWFHSGDRAKAVQFLRRCARYAVEVGRPLYAVQMLERARTMNPGESELALLCEETMIAAKAASKWEVVQHAAAELKRLDSSRAQEHTAAELLVIEALWERTFKTADLPRRLYACVESPAASAEHRLEAATLFFKVAHELALADKAHAVFKFIEPLLLDEKNKCYGYWLGPIIYHTSFGNRDEAFRLIETLCVEVRQWSSVAFRLRANSNIAVALLFLGEPRRAIALYDSLFDEASRYDLTSTQIEATIGACMASVDCNDMAAAQEWHRRCSMLEHTRDLNERELRRLKLMTCEIALLEGDHGKGLSALREVAGIGVGDSARSGAYVAAYPVRLRLLNPDYVCTDDEIHLLVEHYQTTRALNGMDYLVAALVTSLSRNGRTSEARTTANEYIHTYRRERGQLSPQLDKVLRAMRITADQTRRTVAEASAPLKREAFSSGPSGARCP